MSVAAPTLALETDDARMAVKLTVGFPAGVTSASVWRVSTATGNRAYVRGWQDRPTSATTALVYDYEVPLGVEVTYYAQAHVGATASPVGEAAPLVLDDDRDWLIDLARPTNSFPVDVESFPELQYVGPFAVHRVLDRRDPILTTAAVWTPSGTLTFTTTTDDEAERARTILGGGSAVLLRTPPGEGVGNMYLGVSEMREQRISRIAFAADRRFTLEVVQVARPDPALYVPEPPLSYAGRLAEWPTYADVTDTGLSYQEVAYLLPPDRIDPNPPFLPDDV